MERTEVVSKMKGLYAKAAAARKEGKRDVAKQFMHGARRLQRQVRLLPEPKEAKGEESAEA